MIICVTGPMAAGKNTVCKILEQQGFVSIDADLLVHSAIEKSEEKIFATFGEDAKKMGISLKNTDDSLNRRALGKLVFSDPKLLEKQENIVHPFVIQNTLDFIEKNSGKNIIINATVLYKTPVLLSKCEKIIYVDSPKLLRFLRAKKRDKMNTHQILNRFKSQKDLLKNYKQSGIPIVKIKNICSVKRLSI